MLKITFLASMLLCSLRLSIYCIFVVFDIKSRLSQGRREERGNKDRILCSDDLNPTDASHVDFTAFRTSFICSLFQLLFYVRLESFIYQLKSRQKLTRFLRISAEINQ